jgi:hypothetical protein
MAELQEQQGHYVLTGVTGGYTPRALFKFEEEFFALLKGHKRVAVYKGRTEMEQLSVLEHKILEGPRMRFCDEIIKCKGEHLYEITYPIYNNDDGMISISKNGAPGVWLEVIYGWTIDTTTGHMGR